MLEATPERPSRLLLEMMNDRPLYVRGRENPVYMNLRTPPMPQLPAHMRNSVYRFNELNILWTAFHLLDRDRRILISVAQQPEQTMRWYEDAFALPDWQGVDAFTPPEYEDLRARFEEAREACRDYCGEASYELAFLDRGMATNHGQMPLRLRRLMTDLIDRRVCPITLATATLTEGVNLPLDLIFVTFPKAPLLRSGETEIGRHAFVDCGIHKPNWTRRPVLSSARCRCCSSLSMSALFSCSVLRTRARFWIGLNPRCLTASVRTPE